MEFHYLFSAVKDMNLTQYQLSDVLKCLLLEIEFVDAKEINLEIIASCLHHFYLIPNMSVRSCVIRIWLAIDIKLEKPIIERFQFDLLVSSSLQRPLPATLPKLDDERAAAFSYVSYLLRGYNFLPKSIIQALVISLQMQNSPFSQTIAGYLGEAILVCDIAQQMPDLMIILIRYFVETNSNVISLFINYLIEKRLPFIDQFTFWSLLDLLGKEKSDVLLPVFHSYPGLLFFGIVSGCIPALIRSLHSDFTHTYSLIDSILKPCLNNNVYANGICGVILSSFIDSFLWQSSHFFELCAPVSWYPVRA